MKTILTGSNGNLGKHILLEHAGQPITGIHRDNWDILENIAQGSVDVIIHSASDIRKNINENPVSVLDSNIMTTARLLKLASEKGVKKFVFISSCSVYGELSNSLEDKPLQPITMNGHTKAFNEELIKSFCRANGITYLILRVFNSFGGEDQFSVLKKIIDCAKSHSTFTLQNDGVAERDFIHISDVARLTWKLASLELSNEIINIGSGNSVRIIDLVKAVEKKMGPIKVSNKENANESLYSRANLKKLNSLVTFKPIDIFDHINSLT